MRVLEIVSLDSLNLLSPLLKTYEVSMIMSGAVLLTRRVPQSNLCLTLRLLLMTEVHLAALSHHDFNLVLGSAGIVLLPEVAAA